MAAEIGGRASLLVVVAAQAGDRVALERVLATLEEPLGAHLRFLLRDPDLARDVLQDTLLAVARSLPRLRDPRLLRAWAFRIATRAAVRQARRRRRESEAHESSLPPARAVEPDLGDHPFDEAMILELHRQLPDLPPACGAAVRLHYLEEMSLVEVAEALEIPVGTVKSRVSYALALLRERMGPQ